MKEIIPSLFEILKLIEKEIKTSIIQMCCTCKRLFEVLDTDNEEKDYFFHLFNFELCYSIRFFSLRVPEMHLAKKLKYTRALRKVSSHVI